MRSSKALHVILQSTCSFAIDLIDAKPAIEAECEKLGYKAVFHEVDNGNFSDFSGNDGVRAALVLSYSESFLRRILSILKQQDVHPIIVGNDTDTVGCSSLSFDRRKAVLNVIDYFRQNGRSKTALFGINPNASSDLQRKAAFMQKLGENAENAIFFNNGSLQQTAEDFLAVAKEFDSVICANDIAAALLIREAHRKGLRIPDDLFICGSGNTYLAEHTLPTMTSVSLDYSEVGRSAVQLYDFLESMPRHSCARFAVDSVIHVRESTAALPFSPRFNDTYSPSEFSTKLNFINDSDVVALDRINRALSKCDAIDLAILRKTCEGHSRSEVAFELYIGETTLRYRLEKICRAADCKDNAELFALLRRFDIQVNG